MQRPHNVWGILLSGRSYVQKEGGGGTGVPGGMLGDSTEMKTVPGVMCVSRTNGPVGQNPTTNFLRFSVYNFTSKIKNKS